MRTASNQSHDRTLVARVAMGADRVRERIRETAYRGQLGPSREAEWRDFIPRR